MEKEKFKFDKNNLKRGFYISLIIFVGLALAITYFFLIFSGNSILGALSFVVSILRPFIVGAVIAYIMKSTCNFYEKHILKQLLKSNKRTERQSKKKANVIAVVLTYITWVILLGTLLLISIPQIVQSISSFIQDLINHGPDYINTVTAWIDDLSAKNPNLAPYIEKAYAWVLNWLETDLPPIIQQLGGSLINGVFGFVNVLKDIAIGLVISVFFLAGRKTFATKSKLLLHCIFKERTANAIINECRFADRMFGGFLEGKIIDSTIVGVIYYIALVLMDIPYAPLLAVICGVTNIIPFFGPFIGAIPSGFIILMSVDEPIKLLYFIIFVCVAQFIDGNIIDPHIVGGNIKMSPFCVIFAVILFGGLMGFWGLLIGVPTFAVIYDICKKLIMYRFKKKGKIQFVEEQLAEIKDEPEIKTKEKKTKREKKKNIIEQADQPAADASSDADTETDSQGGEASDTSNNTNDNNSD